MKNINIFKITILLLVLIMITACSQNVSNVSQGTSTNTQQPATEEPAKQETTTEKTNLGKLEGPYIITSCGQSPGGVMLNMVAMQADKTSANDNSLTAESLNADEYKTLIVTTGTSMKGMGAAGTDIKAEIERCVSLIESAKEAGLTIVCAHIEGMARRTDSSDAASIDAIIKLADIILVIDDSDSDGLFTKYAEENNKTIIKVKDALAISSEL